MNNGETSLQQNSPALTWECRFMLVDVCNGLKMVAIVLVLW